MGGDGHAGLGFGFTTADHLGPASTTTSSGAFSRTTRTIQQIGVLLPLRYGLVGSSGSQWRYGLASSVNRITRSVSGPWRLVRLYPGLDVLEDRRCQPTPWHGRRHYCVDAVGLRCQLHRRRRDHLDWADHFRRAPRGSSVGGHGRVLHQSGHQHPANDAIARAARLAAIVNSLVGQSWVFWVVSVSRALQRQAQRAASHLRRWWQDKWIRRTPPTGRPLPASPPTWRHLATITRIVQGGHNQSLIDTLRAEACALLAAWTTTRITSTALDWVAVSTP